MAHSDIPESKHWARAWRLMAAWGCMAEVANPAIWKELEMRSMPGLCEEYVWELSSGSEEN